MSWMLAVDIMVLVAIILILFCWFLRAAPEMARKGYKYTAVSISFSWVVIGLFNGALLLLRELAILQQGSAVDGMVSYAYVILVWVALAVLFAGLIVDLVRRSRSSKST
ncbi:MAG: hypothetical protein ACPLRY_05615 [Candidatus Bathyarchaeales archaeon]